MFLTIHVNDLILISIDKKSVINNADAFLVVYVLWDTWILSNTS